MIKKPNRLYKLAVGIIGMVCVMSQSALAGETTTVNVDNFVRAETAAQFDKILEYVNGEINTFVHIREPQPLDKQNVIRMNRDTLYSGAIVDISKGATLVIPETNGRYVSAMIINEDHYVNNVYHDPGTYKLTMEEFGTPYVSVTIRTLVNALDPADIKEANALQDGILITAESAKPYTHPKYDQPSYETAYKALLKLSEGIPDAARTFGKKEDVGEVRHLLGTAYGWGGLPEHEAYYLTVTPNLPVGDYELTVKDVPVDAFWSISLYNKDGYFQENEHNAYSVNSVTATPNKDGSFTIHFGGDPKNLNYLHILEGWNYTVRLYLPRNKILDGSWTFPSVEVAQ